MLRGRDRIGLALIVPAILALMWVTTAQAFLFLWLHEPGPRCDCPFSCAIPGHGGGDPENGGGGPPQGGQNQARTVPLFLIYYP